MGANSEAEPPNGGRGYARTVSLTDAVVAIAMTLLVLPLVDVASEFDSGVPDAWFVAHSGLLLSFVISFLVIFAFWSAHGEIFSRVEDVRNEVPWLRALNMAWLLVIVFLPFPTAVVGHRLDQMTAPFYVGTMLVLSALTSTLSVLTHGEDGRGRAGLVWATTAVFALSTVVACFNADVALYLLLILIPLRVVESRVLRLRGRRVAGRESRDE